MTDAQQARLKQAKRARQELNVQLTLMKLAHSRKRFSEVREWVAKMDKYEQAEVQPNQLTLQSEEQTS